MNLDDIIEQLDATILISNYCFTCLQEKEERRVLLIRIPLEDQDMLPFKVLGVPCCSSCANHIHINEPKTLSSDERELILSKIIWALGNVKVAIMDKHGLRHE